MQAYVLVLLQSFILLPFYYMNIVEAVNGSDILNHFNFSLNHHSLSWQSHEKETLYISAAHYEPFLYKNKDGNVFKGIEFDLLNTIARKMNLKLSFVNWSDDFQLQLR